MVNCPSRPVCASSRQVDMASSRPAAAGVAAASCCVASESSPTRRAAARHSAGVQAAGQDAATHWHKPSLLRRMGVRRTKDAIKGGNQHGTCCTGHRRHARHRRRDQPRAEGCRSHRRRELRRQRHRRPRLPRGNRHRRDALRRRRLFGLRDGGGRRSRAGTARSRSWSTTPASPATARWRRCRATCGTR